MLYVNQWRLIFESESQIYSLHDFKKIVLIQTFYEMVIDQKYERHDLKWLCGKTQEIRYHYLNNQIISFKEFLILENSVKRRLAYTTSRMQSDIFYQIASPI